MGHLLWELENFAKHKLVVELRSAISRHGHGTLQCNGSLLWTSKFSISMVACFGYSVFVKVQLATYFTFLYTMLSETTVVNCCR